MTDEDRKEAERLAAEYHQWSPNQWASKDKYDVERIYLDGYAACAEKMRKDSDDAIATAYAHQQQSDYLNEQLKSERAWSAKLIDLSEGMVDMLEKLNERCGFSKQTTEAINQLIAEYEGK